MRLSLFFLSVNHKSLHIPCRYMFLPIYYIQYALPPVVIVYPEDVPDVVVRDPLADLDLVAA